MKFTLFCAVALFAGLVAATPIDEDKLVIDSDIYLKEFEVYTAEHEIVKIVTPLNDINFEDNDNDDDNDDDDKNISLKFFFVEAEINDKGEKDYKGLYFFQDGNATKLLDNGVDIAVPKGDNKKAYFAAKDGIYVYDAEENKAKKYSSVSDSVISIVHRNVTNDLIFLTEAHALYLLPEEKSEPNLVAEVKDAQDIVIDSADNVYYYGVDKKPYVINESGVVKIEGLPENPTHVNLLNPPFVVEDGVLFVSDEKIYFIFANGTSSDSDFRIEPKSRPTAVSLEPAILTYYAHDKKIYQFNVLVLVLAELAEELKNFIEENKDTVQEIATKFKQL